MNRREFMSTTGAALAASTMASSLNAEEKVNHPVMNNTDYFWVRGFNYQPGYASHGIQIWTDFRKNEIERELLHGKECFPEMTALRIWVSFDAYICDPVHVPQRVSTMIDLAEKVGVKVMLCLFNGWHSLPEYGGISPETITNHHGIFKPGNWFDRYADAIFERHHDDERVFGWDLCNEPFNSGGQQGITKWLTYLYNRLKTKDSKAQFTVGINKLDWMKQLNPVCDFFTPHLYWNGFDPYVQYANKQKKGMFSSEIGWGSLDDTVRMNQLNKDLSSCVSRKIGFLIHALNHSLVADLHRPEYGPVTGAGYMACIEADGSIRKGHEAINKYLCAR